MKTYRREIVEREIQTLESITCDVCKKVIRNKDFVEFDEIVSIEFIGGYGSVFGDGEQVSIDMCQDCFKKILGEFVTTFYVGD